MIRVLVVEDEFLIRTVAVEQFEDAGFDVHEAASGDEALAILQGDRDWQVLLTDIRMPGEVDGWQLGRLALQLIPSLGVVYVTGFSEDIPELHERERFLKKPYLFREISHELRTLGVIAE